MAAGDTRLERHPRPHQSLVNPLPDHGDDSGGLVTQHQRCLDDEVCDPSVLEVVHVRAADGDDLDAHLGLPGCGLRDSAVLGLEPTDLLEDHRQVAGPLGLCDHHSL